MDPCLVQFAIIGVGLGIGAVCRIFGQLPNINEEQVFNPATATIIQSHITTIIQPATTVFRPTATVTATETVTRTVISYQERKPRADYAQYLVDLMVPRIVNQFSMWAAFILIAGSVITFSFTMCEKMYHRKFGNKDKADKGPRKGDGPADTDVKADPNQVTTSKKIKPRTTAEGQPLRKGVQPTHVKGQAHQSKTDSSEDIQSPHTEFEESTNPFGAVQDDLFAKMSGNESFDHAELVKEIESRGATDDMVNPTNRQDLDEQADTVENIISNELISKQQPAQSAADDMSPPSPSTSFVSDFEAALQNEESTSTPLQQVTNIAGADNASQTASDESSPVQEEISSNATEESTDSISQQITNSLADDTDDTKDEVSSIASETFVDATGPEDIAIETPESPTKPSEVTREGVQPSDVDPEEHADGSNQEQSNVEDSSTELREEPREDVQSSDVEPEVRAREVKQEQEQAKSSPNNLTEEPQEEIKSSEPKTVDQATGLKQEQHSAKDSDATLHAKARGDVQSPDVEPEEQDSESRQKDQQAEASHKQPLNPLPRKPFEVIYLKRDSMRTYAKKLLESYEQATAELLGFIASDDVEAATSLKESAVRAFNDIMGTDAESLTRQTILARMSSELSGHYDGVCYCFNEARHKELAEKAATLPESQGRKKIMQDLSDLADKTANVPLTDFQHEADLIDTKLKKLLKPSPKPTTPRKQGASPRRPTPQTSTDELEQLLQTQLPKAGKGNIIEQCTNVINDYDTYFIQPFVDRCAQEGDQRQNRLVGQEMQMLREYAARPPTKPAEMHAAQLGSALRRHRAWRLRDQRLEEFRGLDR